jgi:hypothetical protein
MASHPKGQNPSFFFSFFAMGWFSTTPDWPRGGSANPILAKGVAPLFFFLIFF